MDWIRFLQGVGEVAQGTASVMAVRRLLDLDDNTAFARIADFVESSGTAEIDAFDGVLLSTATGEIDLHARARLIKFYAFFKMLEYMKFNRFRGFPH
ncbi:hypothetical protein PWG71_19155 [Nocardiopsis sp. N85]|uniref:hypothetical protein n=1 Tax=Nocardiopsis sp. N85 TaxID=3029400 RepID=UPI00237EEDD6|nr:hypothetical protein [Nocardiopsis sp. N85]MDE3723513.1 hypothetical protein [Nocardiopsis sp. N85]